MGMWVQSLVLLSGLRIWCCRELWYRLAVTATIRPLAWELPCATGVALKRKEKKKDKKALSRFIRTTTDSVILVQAEANQ